MLWIGPCLLVLIVTAYALAVRGYLRPRRERVTASPADFGLHADAVTLTTSDGLELAGWWMAREGARGAIVLCHGYRSQRGAMLGVAAVLNRAGYSSLGCDFRAHGDSCGSLTTLGLKEVKDITAAVDYCVAVAGPNTPIGVLGISMGGAAAIMAAATDRRIRAVVSDSAYADLHSAISTHLAHVFGPFAFVGAPMEWLGRIEIGAKAGSVSPEAAARKLAPTPLLIIHGDDDSIVPSADAKRLLEAAGGVGQIWLLPGVGHVEAFEADPDTYTEHIVSFFHAAFANQAAAPHAPTVSGDSTV